MPCPACSKEIVGTESYCPHCGYPLKTPTVQCGYCKAMVAADLETCPQCNVQLFKGPARGPVHRPPVVAKKRSMGWGMATVIGCGGCVFIIYLAAAVGNSCQGSSRSAEPPSPAAAQATQPLPKTKEVESLKLKRGTIKVGMTFDSLLEVIPGKHISNLDSLGRTKKCSVEGREFTIRVERTEDPGPYRLVGIEIPTTTATAVVNPNTKTPYDPTAKWGKDRVAAARNVMAMANRDCNIYAEDPHLVVEMRMYIEDRNRLLMYARAIADADAILNPTLRPIYFHDPGGKMVATAHPSQGVQLKD